MVMWTSLSLWIYMWLHVCSFVSNFMQKLMDGFVLAGSRASSFWTKSLTLGGLWRWAWFGSLGCRRVVAGELIGDTAASVSDSADTNAGEDRAERVDDLVKLLSKAWVAKSLDYGVESHIGRHSNILLHGVEHTQDTSATEIIFYLLWFDCQQIYAKTTGG